MTEALYFFVSYAHLPPTDENDAPDDPVVTDFFEDLSEEVRALTGAGPGWVVGTYDRAVPSGDDVGAAVTRGLSQAEVLVPLYSPRYLRGAWTTSEHQSFVDRLDRTAADTTGHIQLILWVPLPPGESLPEGTDLSDLGADSPDYAVNGLRMLRELTIYRPQYDAIVRRLAQRIVAVVQNSPIGPSSAPPPAVPNPAAGTAQFAVAIIAPTMDSLPPTRRPEAYRDSPTEWRPFVTAPAVPVARQAATVAERLGLPTAVTTVENLTKDYANTPAVVLIDPWILAVHGGRSRLEQTIAGLAEWVLPLVVCDTQDPQYAERGMALSEAAVDMLGGVGTPRAPKDARAAADVVKAMPQLVMQARRRFLHSRQGSGVRRPRLSDPNPPEPPSSPPTPGADDR